MNFRLFHKHTPEKTSIVYQGYDVYSCQCGELFALDVNLLRAGITWMKFDSVPKRAILGLMETN